MLYYGCDYYPEHWPASRWEVDARLMQDAGFNVARIGEFAWARMEPREGHYAWDWLDRAIELLARHGIHVVLSTPTAAPPPWLTTAYPEVLPHDRHRHVRHAGSRRHYCPNSAVYRDHTRRIVTALADRYGGDERIIGWQTDNEFGCRDTNTCYCDTCAERFREWLQGRHGSLEALNRSWGSIFWSALYSDWQEIPLPWDTPMQHNPSHVLDFLRFSSDSVCDYQLIQIEILRERAPSHFVTHNLMPMGARGLDFYDLAGPLDFVSWDNYHFHGATPAIVAATHDLYWGMKRRNYWIMEQQVGNVNWTPYNPTFRPGEVRLKVWQSVAHGADGIVFFRWRAAQIGAELYHSGLLDHGGRSTRGYYEAKAIGQESSKLSHLLRGSVPQAEVAFLHDYPSRWSLDLQPHNRDLADDQTFRRALMGPYEALMARNVPVHVLPARAQEDLSAYKTVILPAINLMSPETVERLVRYVQGGGLLIATARTGFKNESGLVPGPPPGHLADLLGVAVEEIDSQPPDHLQGVRFVGGPEGTARASLWFESLAPTSARPLAVYEDDYYGGRAAATIRDTGVGLGMALYVGVLAGADFYGRLFDWLFSEAHMSIEPLVDTPPGVEASSRVGPEGRVLFLLNHNDAGVSVVLPAGCLDALTDEPVSGDLELRPRGVRILSM